MAKELFREKDKEEIIKKLDLNISISVSIGKKFTMGAFVEDRSYIGNVYCPDPLYDGLSIVGNSYNDCFKNAIDTIFEKFLSTEKGIELAKAKELKKQKKSL